MSRRITVEVPAILRDRIEISGIYENQNASGRVTSYGIDLELSELNLQRELKSKEFHLLQPKVQSTLATWAKKYTSHQQRQHRQAQAVTVDQLNAEAIAKLEALHGLLAHTLSVDDAVNWDSLKRTESYRANPEEYMYDPPPRSKVSYSQDGRPTGAVEVTIRERPHLEGVRSQYGLVSRLFRRRKIQADFEAQTSEWERHRSEVEAETNSRQKLLREAITAYEAAETAFREKQGRDNDAIDALRARYDRQDPSAVEECCELVLGASKYPDYFPQSWSLEFRPEGRLLVVDYNLPAPSQLPTIESYRYMQGRDEILEKQLPAAGQRRLYDSAIYQVCIRTLHELFEADTTDALDAVVFNGRVAETNRATGMTEEKTILSVMASKAEFLTFDLSRIDPMATFKHLKGVAAAALVDLAPIPPVVALTKSDKRFIEGREITSGLDGSINIAAMDWGDFEHLIRELFEQEFVAAGGEVRVTQPSSDGGVDAIAFDPDPIRGGKIVIQAKRYTNTVGVAAVRDLYGTVMNEGATKGILVTTSDYGRDSYEFAKDKPLTLLNGSNLLAMLQKHGHRARINVEEARRALKRL